MMEYVEKIDLEFDKLGINSSTLREYINQFIDYIFQTENEMNLKLETEKNLQQEINKLLNQLTQKQKTLQFYVKNIIQDLERIELQLYEKNEYNMLKDIIEFVKSCKVNHSKCQKNTSFCDSQISQPNPNEEAFYFSNSLMMPNTIGKENSKLQEIVQTINKSSVSLSQKEQLVYNVIKSQTNQSQLQHVNLDDMLEISYHPNQKKGNTSILSSIPIPLNDINTNNKFNKVKLFDTKDMCPFDELHESPKFQFSELSPIHKQSSQKGTNLSFKKEESEIQEIQQIEELTNKNQNQKIQIPKINLQGLIKLETQLPPLGEQQQAPKKRPKPLSHGEKHSFYEKSSFLNMISRSRDTRDTKDTEKKSESLNSRARNQTFHTSQFQKKQSIFLKDLMERVHKQKGVVVAQPYKISEYEKKQLSLLIGKLKQRKKEQFGV